MKKTITIVALAVMVTAMGVKAYAADASPKIAYIDLQQILLQSNEGKKAKTSLEKEFAVRKEALKKQKQELESLQSAIEAQSSLLSHDALMQKQEDFLKKRDAFLKQVQKYDSDLQEKDGELTKHILLQLQDIITKIGRDGKYNLIVEKSQGGVLYAPDNEDITGKVMKLFNEKYAKEQKAGDSGTDSGSDSN